MQAAVVRGDILARNPDCLDCTGMTATAMVMVACVKSVQAMLTSITRAVCAPFSR